MNNNVLWKKQIIHFLSAQTISLFGSSLVQYAIVWYVTLTTSSGKMLTLSTLCGFLPQILISLFAGVWIDRYNRKLLIMVSDGIIALSTLLLALVFFTGHKTIWLLFLVLIIRSAGTGIQTPAVNALIPQIVPKEQLMRVNGIHSSISSFVLFLSPGVSGAVLSLASFEATLLIDVVTALIGIGITASIPIKFIKKKSQQSSVTTEIREGFQYLKQNQVIKRILMFQIVILFLISPSAFLTPLMISREFGPEVWRLTFSEMTYSLGTVLGGILMASWGGFQNRIKTTVLAGTAYGLLMIGLGAMPIFWAYLVFNLFIGVTAPCYNAPITVLLQEQVDKAMHGRVFSFMQISTSCALPLGMVLFGPLADAISVQQLLIISGSMVAAFVLVFQKIVFRL